MSSLMPTPEILKAAGTFVFVACLRQSLASIMVKVIVCLP